MVFSIYHSGFRGHSIFDGPSYYPKPSRVYHNKRHPGVRNAKVAEQMNAMHEKWMDEQFPSRVAKEAPTVNSISTVKLQTHCHRHVARRIVQLAAQNEATAGQA